MIMATTNATNENPNRELSITRILNAPIELVWKVWTEPEHIAKWWGPNGFSNTIHIMEVKPGGTWDFIMHGPDGTDYKNTNRFTEVIKYKKLSFEHITGPLHSVTVLFTAQGDKTLLEWKSVFQSAEQLEQVIKVFKADVGMRQNVEKLEVYLANNK